MRSYQNLKGYNFERLRLAVPGASGSFDCVHTEGCFKKLAVLGAFAVASMTAVTPLASAATSYYAGTYPSYSAAIKACNDGKAQGRWHGCSYKQVVNGGGVQLWVYVR